MKKYIGFLIIVFLSSCVIHGQEKVIIHKKGEPLTKFKKGNYYKIPEEIERGKPFEGVWEYKNGNESFIIKITMEKTLIPKFEFYLDKLQLEFSYDKGNGQIISNKTRKDNSKIGNIIENNENKASFMSYDMVKKKGIDINLELLGENKVKMTLTNWPGGITIISPNDPKPKKDMTFSIPTGIILTKQNSNKITE
ncbi:DUF6705 family protein [Flavobacterium sp. '19STA2R22 D10 B1']|uniref:DUF6705 family protein n=1 Tax=Flavobacterium aerium TaxID=3037261 RepID=UPI00278C1EE4|nr:DUF6705 family protein [Flavobacterium sp. '19STA2R22 D10 B1']